MDLLYLHPSKDGSFVRRDEEMSEDISKLILDLPM
jgi:hypothetical protein